jgi:hypothetical protein
LVEEAALASRSPHLAPRAFAEKRAPVWKER